MRRRLERRVDAYRDGGASPRARAALERRATPGSEADRLLRDREALGSAIREAWTEGPPAPAPAAWIADLRRGLAAVDAELEREGPLTALLGRFREFRLQPVPVLAVGAAAAAVLAVLLIPTDGERESAPIATAFEAGAEPIRVAEADQAEVYDLQGDGLVMVFDELEATLIWVVEEPDDLSGRFSGPDEGWA
jgi:hypothetical protein